jgi:TonB-linked SusC/RagA family outer membrane protein
MKINVLNRNELWKKMKPSLALSFLFCVSSQSIAKTNVKLNLTEKDALNISQQQITIKGKVVSAEDNMGIPGVNVNVKGAGGGVSTDIDGNFTINVPSSNSVLVFSAVGMKTQEVKVGTQKVINVVMTPDLTALNEVVVVGFGTQKKATLTGAVSVLSSKTFEGRGAVSSPLQVMQGTVPGVIVTRSSGAPGEEGWAVKLRGAASANSTNPLIIIDGIEFNDGIGGLRNINPEDIESMNILKDASASIYGARAAGGVILITTKKAKSGEITVQYNSSFTGKTIGLQPQLMNLDQWSNAVLQARRNDGLAETDTWIRYAQLAQQYKGQYLDMSNSREPIPGNFAGVFDFVFIENDWQKLLWGDAFSTQHQLSVSGGSENSQYRLSLGYLNDVSTLKWGNNSKDRYNLRLSNSFKFNDKVSLESVIAYGNENQVKPSRITDVLPSSSYAQPGLPSQTIDGKPYAWGNWRAPNWLAELGGDNTLKVKTVNISEELNWKIDSNFKFTTQLGYNNAVAVRDIVEKPIDFYNYAGTKVSWSGPTQADSKYTKSFSNNDFYSVTAFLNWNKEIANSHNLSAMLGTQYNYNLFERTEMSIKDIKSSLQIPNGTGVMTIDAEKWHEAMMSYFGRVNYNYKQRYLVEANMRYDGSSKFQPVNRWNFFWGASGGWRITQEEFMESIKSVVNDLKLRFSYGVLGNQSGINRYDGSQLYNFSSASGALIDGTRVSTINTNGQIASTGRTWERIYNYNLALDFGFLNNRLTGTAEIFLKNNNNMLIAAQYPGILGDKAPAANIGKYEAKGFEGNLTWSDKIGQVKYRIGGNFTYVNNKLIDLGATNVLTSGYRATTQGYSLNSYFGLLYTGKIQTQQELQKYKDYYLSGNGIGLPSNIRLGDNMFEDVNKDGKLDQNDYVYLGSDDPKVSYSITGGAEWKSFDFSFILQGAAQRTIFRDGPNWRIPMRQVFVNTTNQSVGNTWSTENRDAYYPTYTNNSALNTYNYQASSWSVENGAYIRLKNISLGYTLPESFTNKTKFISKLRIFLTGDDLWENSKIKDGWDPEQTRDVSGLGRFPFNRTLTLGLSATF